MKIAFVASSTPQAQESFQILKARYGSVALKDADCVVTIGGDGLVLKTFYSVVDHNKPVFAMRRTSSVGFLCNDYDVDDLPQRLAQAQKVVLHPLRVDCVTAEGAKASALAVNEIVMLRDTPQSAKLRVLVDGIERIERYSGDGLLVATPAGSTAYNHSAGGPIMPLDANTLIMTAICGFRPRRWSYAVLSQSMVVDIEALETEKRPVRIEAGPQSIHHVKHAKIELDRTVNFTLLFDPDQHLGERIVQEQFMA
jgi:NAD+ kinase